MKQKFILAMALLLCAALVVGCAAGGDGTPGSSPLPVQIPNPIAEVGSAADFAPLSVAIDAPQNASDAAYSIIGDAIAQVTFTLDEHAYTYRAAKGGEDISGVYETFAEETLNVNWEFEEKDVSAAIKTAKNGGRLATWYEAGTAYSLWTADAVSDDAMSSLVLKLVVQQGLADPERAPAPFAPIDFLDARTCKADLDGDGEMETISLVTTMDEYDWAHNTITVTTADGTVCEFHPGEEEWLLEIQYITALQIIDIDPDDGLLEIVLSGDYMSADYATLVCRFDGTQILLSRYEEPRTGESCSGLRGDFQSVENGVVTIADSVDVLGTWWGTRRYTLAGDGTFTFIPVEGELWQRAIDLSDPENWTGEYGPALETAAELPVTLDGSGETTLPAGTKLIVTGSDETSIARFVLEDGRTGSIAFTRNEEGWPVAYIDGVEELEYFVNLPYAG